MARPRFVPTVEQRKSVRAMPAYGIRQEEIASYIGLRSPKTLRQYFREELDRASAEANARVAQTLYHMAISGKDPAATIFWLKSRAGWGERAFAPSQPGNAPAFVVEREKEAV